MGRPAELIPEWGDIGYSQVINKTSFVSDHFWSSLFLTNTYLFCILGAEFGVQFVYTSAKLATLSTSLGNTVAFTMLAHIVILHKGPQGQGNTATSNWTKSAQSVFSEVEKGSQLPWPRAQLALQPKVTEAEGHFLCSQEFGFPHQQPYAFGNIHQLENSLSWKKTFHRTAQNTFFKLMENW